MKRRDFIARIAGAIVGASIAKELGAQIITKLPQWVPNPAYIDAPLEIEMLFNREAARMAPMIAETLSKSSPWVFTIDPHPLRFECNQGEPIRIIEHEKARSC